MQGTSGAQGVSGVPGVAGPPGAPGGPGPAGPQGAPGPIGLQGAAGLQGPVGATGPQGPTGPQGLIGPTGTTGATGAVGPQGAAGPAGPVGMIFRGTYTPSTSYAAGDGVSYDGAGYVSLVNGNLGNAPDQTPLVWGKFAAGTQGPVGATGQQGVMGPQGGIGPVGATGPAGPQGPAGPVGMSFRGNYSPSMVYALGDGVSYDGAGYVSLMDGNMGNVPDQAPASWGKFAAGSQGATGATGVQGPQGPAGAPGMTGPQGPIGAVGAIGPQGLAGPQGLVGPAGATGATGSSGPQGPQGLSGLPGPSGPAGVQGLQGPAGVSFKGTWSGATGYLQNDAVFYQGSTYLALATSLAAPPDTTPSAWAVLAQSGAVGATGPSGSSATVNIGTVTTTAPGTLATVTNSGSPTAAVLDFTIPQGTPGASGGGTGSGSGWGSFVSMYHPVSFMTNFYSVSNASANVSEVDAILTWVPSGCTATALAVFSRQRNTIQVTLRVGLPGAMTATSLTCSVDTGASCTATGSVAIPAGSFVDLQIEHPSGSPDAVWTAVACS